MGHAENSATRPSRRYSSLRAPPQPIFPVREREAPPSVAANGENVATFRSTRNSAEAVPNGTPRSTKPEALSRPSTRGSEKLRERRAAIRPAPPRFRGGVRGSFWMAG